MFYVYLGNDLIYEPLSEDLALFNPKLTLEMGKAGSLEFDIPQTNPFYNSLTQLASLVNVKLDSEELFRGRVLSNERQFSNIRHVYCEGDLAFLVDSVQKTEKYSGKTRALFTKLIQKHNSRVEAYKQFTIGTVTIEDRSIILEGQVDDLNTGNIDYKQIAINSIVGEWSTTFEQIETCLIDHCGGYLRTRHQNGVNYLDFVQEYGSTATQEIELGSNLLDLTEEITAEDLFTVLIPLGDDNLTIASVNGGSDELVDTNAVAKYGRIVKTHVFSNVNEPSTLLENGRRYLASNVNVPRTVTITAVDLHLLNSAIEAIHLGDRVHISSNPHNMDEYLTCTKIEYDLANPANNKYTFGNPKQTLTERYKEDQRKQNDVYGNGSGGGGGGGRGGGAAATADAAEAAADAAAEDAGEELKHFYKTYIDLDGDDDGTVSLKVLLENYRKDRKTLNEDVGIDLDAETGNVNLHSLKTTVDNNTNDITTQIAKLDLFTTETESSIASITEWQNQTDNTLASHSTRIEQVSNDAMSQIELKATELNNSIDGETDRATKAEAAISLRVSNNESNITLKADQINLDAALTRISNLETDFADINKLKARIGSISGLSVISGSVQGTWSVSGELRGSSITTGDGEPVYSYMHSHVVTANDDGTVSFGVATKTIPQSFNIADTNFYKNGVSAAKESVRVKTIMKNQSAEVSYGEATKTVYYPVYANTTSYETFHKPTILAVPAKHFWDAVTISSVAVDSFPDPTTVRVVATAANGVTGGADLDVSTSYNAGVGSVSVSSIGGVWTGNTLTVTAKASNNAQFSRDFSAQGIYDNGYNAGKAAAGNVDVSYSGGSYDIWINGRQKDEEQFTYAVQIGVRLTNGITRYSGYLYT